MGLAALPNELVHAIIHFLAPQPIPLVSRRRRELEHIVDLELTHPISRTFDRWPQDEDAKQCAAALFAVSFADRRMYHIAKSLLYTNVNVWDGCSMVLLLRTFLEQPTLATGIVHLAFPFCTMDEPHVNGAISAWNNHLQPTTDVDQLSAASRRVLNRCGFHPTAGGTSAADAPARLPLCSSEETIVRTSHVNNIYGALMTMTTNASTLLLRLPASDQPYWDDFLRMPLGPGDVEAIFFPPVEHVFDFPNITTLKLKCNYDDAEEGPQQHYAGLSEFPRLRKLELCIHEPSILFSVFADDQLRQIEELNIYDSYLPVETLTDIVSRCRNLRALHIDLAYSFKLVGHVPRDIVDAIKSPPDLKRISLPQQFKEVAALFEEEKPGCAIIVRQ